MLPTRCAHHSEGFGARLGRGAEQLLKTHSESSWRREVFVVRKREDDIRVPAVTALSSLSAAWICPDRGRCFFVLDPALERVVEERRARLGEQRGGRGADASLAQARGRAAASLVPT